MSDTPFGLIDTSDLSLHELASLESPVLVSTIAKLVEQERTQELSAGFDSSI
ncbi:hypothetical protein [Acrocarpospora catenulata]|uniref:hypothetical protein n=1 Tax=Acrocarpospora catenulata TaxID=2836182 RepID=UPI001BD9C4B8|nr:hypothetical protein [Acrocarpospora catenulata]